MYNSLFRSLAATVTLSACGTNTGGSVVPTPEVQPSIDSAEPFPDSLPVDAYGSSSRPWWRSGPGPDASPPLGTVPTSSHGDVECAGDDPFDKMFTCSGSCQYMLADFSDLKFVPDGRVVKFGAAKLLVSDVRVANVKLVKWLANPPLFEGAPFGPAPKQAFRVQERPTGFSDVYLAAGAGSEPSYISTNWKLEMVVPPYATLPASGRAIMGIRDSGDIVNPDDRVATVVMPVTDEGMVDMTSLAGTTVNKASGWPADTPSGFIPLAEAEAWFAQVITYNGAKCFPDAEATPL